MLAEEEGSSAMKRGEGQRAEMSGKEFAELFDALSTWGRWGEGDERGTLHYASETTVVAGAALVRDGRTTIRSLPTIT